MKVLVVELECLLEQDLVLYRPLVRIRREIRHVGQRFGDVVLVPAEHSERLLHVVVVFLFGDRHELFHWVVGKKKKKIGDWSTGIIVDSK